VYRTLNTNKKVKYMNFLHEVGNTWISEVQNKVKSSSDDLQLTQKETTPRGPKQDLPGRLSRDFRIYKVEKNCCWWKGKKEVSCKTV